MSKDWTGNKRAVFSTLGASNHSLQERESMDFYATDPAVLDLLARKYDIPDVVMEPACGTGCLSEWLIGRGHKVYSSDIVDRGYGEVANFFEMLTIPGDCNCILTNPPYKYATEFVLHSLELLRTGGQAVFFLKTTFLETERRYNEIFRIYPPVMCSSSSDVRCVPKTQTLRRRGGWAVRSATLSSSGRRGTMASRCWIGFRN